MGVTAASGQVTPAAIALFGILFLWQMPHFLAIAILYKRDYAAGGFKMLPVVDSGLNLTSRMIVLYGMAIWDPIEVISRIGSPLVIIVAAMVVLCAQLHTNMAANIVSPANDFSHLNPRKISFVTGGVITAVIGILMFPWKLYSDASAYIFNWLVGYSSLMGALGGILIADYWIIRRQKLSVPDLFKENGAYSYTNGINIRAVVVLIVSVAPVVPGFVRAAITPGGQVTNPTVFDTLYTYAWFVTFGLSFVLYLAVSRSRDRRG